MNLLSAVSCRARIKPLNVDAAPPPKSSQTIFFVFTAVKFTSFNWRRSLMYSSSQCFKTMSEWAGKKITDHTQLLRNLHAGKSDQNGGNQLSLVSAAIAVFPCRLLSLYRFVTNKQCILSMIDLRMFICSV